MNSREPWSEESGGCTPGREGLCLAGCRCGRSQNGSAPCDRALPHQRPHSIVLISTPSIIKRKK